MKIILTVLFFCALTTVKAQDITKSDFYNSFYNKMGFQNYTDYKDRVGIHSIKMLTDDRGIIRDYIPSTSMDSILRQDIARAFKTVDKAGLKAYNYQNSELILPIIILNGKLTEINPGMWQFNDKEVGLLCNQKLLPPIVIFLGFNKMIPN